MVIFVRDVVEPVEGRPCVLPLMNAGLVDNGFVYLVKDLLTYFA